MVNGIKQKPIEGVSMVYTFDKANANAPSKRETQYFEMVGNRAIYHDGWIARHDTASTPLGAGNRQVARPSTTTTGNSITSRRTIRNTTISPRRMPDKLKEMQALFLTEAAKYHVFPLDNSVFPRLMTPRPSAIAGKTLFTYTGENAGIPVGNAPSILDKDYTITAEITFPKAAPKE